MIQAKGKTTDLDSMSIEELVELISTADKKRSEKLLEAKRQLIEETTERARKIGLELSDLFERPAIGVKRSGSVKSLVEPKFKGPSGELWSGRGRKPKWIVALEATGHDIQEFRI